MASFKRFEDIQAWQKARLGTKRVYEVSKNAEFARDFGLCNQIRRASVSVMANLAEGNGRRTNIDFASYVVQAHGSAAEVQSHLYVALDLKYIGREEFNELFTLFDEISKMTMSLSVYLRKSQPVTKTP